MKILQFMLFIALVSFVNGESTIAPNKPYAYAANAGWVSFLPSEAVGVRVENSYLSGYAYAANFGWIHLGGGDPINGVSYGNNLEDDYGVNRDPQGNLSGFAYSGNVGWINFNWTDLNDPNRPRINPNTGEILGYAYSANVGWILLGTSKLFTFLPSPGDEDGDFIDDDWEVFHFNGTDVASIGTDSDGDGQSDASEAVAGTEPTNSRSYFRIMSMEFDSEISEASITFSSSLDIQYLIEKTENLDGSWEDSGMGLVTSELSGSKTISVPFSPGTNLFFRVSVHNPDI